MISSTILEAYAPLFKDYTLNFNHVGSSELYIPRFSKEVIINLCKDATEKFKEDDVLLDIKSPFNVVGDIHGNIRDLVRIFAMSGSPYNNGYLFLGDYVDRGEMSLEVATLLFALKVSFPSTIFLIRGNHEFKEINENYGFKEQCLEAYDESVYEAFNEAFTWMPLAAVIDKCIFAVHGGISPVLYSLTQIKNIQRPIVSLKDKEDMQLVSDILWSDPSSSTPMYLPSQRGFGCIYGVEALHIFRQNTEISAIIRAHQCVPGGIQRIKSENFYTVFSSSSYAEPPNKAGVIYIENCHIKCTSYEPIKQLKKEFAVYKDFDTKRVKIPLCSRTQRLSFVNPANVRGRRASVGVGLMQKMIPTIRSGQSESTLNLAAVIPKPRPMQGHFPLVRCMSPGPIVKPIEV